jgi:hypothetical protein
LHPVHCADQLAGVVRSFCEQITFGAR